MPGFGLHSGGVRGTTRPSPPQPPWGVQAVSVWPRRALILQDFMLVDISLSTGAFRHSIHSVFAEGSNSALCFQAAFKSTETWPARAPSLVPS